jgi:hypothetical protein
MNAPLLGNASLSRKRSRIELEDGDSEGIDEGIRLPSPVELKKRNTQCELDAIGIVSPEDAWNVDVEGILSSPTLPTSPGIEGQPHNNMGRFHAEESIMVLCVQGNVQLHYDLLW